MSKFSNRRLRREGTASPSLPNKWVPHKVGQPMLFRNIIQWLSEFCLNPTASRFCSEETRCDSGRISLLVTYYTPLSSKKSIQIRNTLLEIRVQKKVFSPTWASIASCCDRCHSTHFGLLITLPLFFNSVVNICWLELDHVEFHDMITSVPEMNVSAIGNNCSDAESNGSAKDQSSHGKINHLSGQMAFFTIQICSGQVIFVSGLGRISGRQSNSLGIRSTY